MMSGARRIVVDARTYSYRVGRMTTVVRREDESVLAKVPNHEVGGVSAEVFARGQWKRSSDGRITPKDVERSIRWAESKIAQGLE